MSAYLTKCIQRLDREVFAVLLDVVFFVDWLIEFHFPKRIFSRMINVLSDEINWKQFILRDNHLKNNWFVLFEDIFDEYHREMFVVYSRRFLFEIYLFQSKDISIDLNWNKSILHEFDHWLSKGHNWASEFLIEIDSMMVKDWILAELDENHSKKVKQFEHHR